MASSGSCIFVGVEEYRANLPWTASLLAASPISFRARLTWVELQYLHLMRGQENGPRVRHVTLPADRVFAIFPVHRGTVLIHDDVEVCPGTLMLHAIGASFREQTNAPSRWGMISLPLGLLSAYSRTLTERTFTPPLSGRLFRPPVAAHRQLRRLLGCAARLAETRLAHITHPQIARALEQEMIWALVICVAGEGAHETSSIGAQPRRGV